VAHQYQQVTDWHTRMPDLEMSGQPTPQGNK